MRAPLVAATLALAAASTGSAFILPSHAAPRAAARSAVTTTMTGASEAPVERRTVLARSTAGAALALLGVAVASPAARAADEVPLVRDKMGGLLEPYTDIAKVGGCEHQHQRSRNRGGRLIARDRSSGWARLN
jgi:hypothetical protein